ncbi:CDC73-domain-containing protein [Hortaea werneckii]|uniref:Cell division control protein 73 C-terminal domain-containing protein n=2 Tax=Hortaea werneckii TaxID=91943 RepID=A0A3M7I2E9_HORWE|nr:CDC73-domain-containing protein [Hortaea werneckii]OTA37490.1 hypothetical protein BTJ68_02226 [Hortaea werneckii EXF-2000]KAI6799135.1 CDC73-domain-containing protein [Hortaea werneckii]KAI6827904.1 CDC73-domain-containing protein [Hortaea werneckii]KAI6901864.1 CDC73-domain-containing protein [Hortaea werneckii]
MAAIDGLPPDPLSLLRQSIAHKTLPIASVDQDPSTATETTPSLAKANYLVYNLNGEHTAIPLTQPTRFISQAAGSKGLDLRSVYFCWLNKDNNVGEYLAAIGTLNDELKGEGKDETVTNLVFGEKIDLTAWLAGETDEEGSEFIRSLDANRASRAAAHDAAAIARGDGDVEMRDADGLTGDAEAKAEQDRLRAIYAGERKMGDRNTALRGPKMQDFGDVRKKYSALFFSKRAAQQTHANGAPGALPNSNPALRPPVKGTPSGRRPEPIILLSPSASSLLRMPNIKAFLEEGQYMPPEGGSASNILHLTRLLPSISPKPIRFILVDDPSTFRPDYWDRLVAVFTTGQTWQFKGYKWTQPAELFSHALGVYVGWKGEVVPDSVKGWGRGVMVAQIDKGAQRWRDREVVEEVWRGIEGRMKAMGWGKEGAK